MTDRIYNGPYTGNQLERVAFPLGGMGAGMVCLEGAGALSHVSIRNEPDVFNEPLVFSAIHVKGDTPVSRVLEGPVPTWKVMFPWGKGRNYNGAGNGAGGKHYGLPRFADAAFSVRFPFAEVALRDEAVPLHVTVTGWSPFIPGDADASSLPVAALEFSFTNSTDASLEAVYSFHARNVVVTDTPGDRVEAVPGGFVLYQPGSDEKPADQAALAATVDADSAVVDAAWFRGGWFDSLTMVWRSVSTGAMPNRPGHPDGEASPGGSLYVPLQLEPGETQTVRLRLAWHVPVTTLRTGEPKEKETCCCGDRTGSSDTHRPWYAGRFADIAAVADHWDASYDRLRAESAAFRDCFYDTTLPPEVVEAVAANLTILKSPTVLRQTDGRLWCWEGCCDCNGCCAGSCTHVWNYTQAIAHLFPELERGLRETEHLISQDERGHQNFRTWLPIRPCDHNFHAASDGQLGGVMKVYREWRISGDTEWMRKLWPRVAQSLAYCIETWDPRHRGLLEEPHHNTYDIEFWGPDGMCTSFYLGALKAAALMADELDEGSALYRELYEKGRRALESELFDGEYFIQRMEWKELGGAPETAKSFHTGYSSEALELLEAEGPKYQYGNGCISDGVLGVQIAEMAGLGEVLDSDKVASHLLAVYRHNLCEDLSDHANPQRPSYALGEEGGLLLCSWPKGGDLSLPFVYSNEVWTGIEYQVAAHLMLTGHVEEGLDIVRACRDRYDGRVRNPFNEYECGHWYARALASYGLIRGLTGARYDAVERVLYVDPQTGGDWRAFLATERGYGTVGMRDGEPFLDVVRGEIPVDRIERGNPRLPLR